MFLHEHEYGREKKGDVFMVYMCYGGGGVRCYVASLKKRLVMVLSKVVS